MQAVTALAVGGIVLPVVGVAVAVLAVVTLRSAVEVVDAYENCALVVGGEYRRMLEPGLDVVPSFVSRTRCIDRRTMQFEPDVDDLETRDGTPVAVDLVAEYRVDDPEPVKAAVEGALGRLRDRGVDVEDVRVEGVRVRETGADRSPAADAAGGPE